MRFFRLLILAAILALIAFPLDLAYTAQSSTFTATSVLDNVDANPGDGECADVGGNCTLRAAVMEANAIAGPDTIILLEDTYHLTLAGDDEDDAATGDLDLQGGLTIIGAGPETTIIDAEQADDRIFHILSAADVSISGISIRNGNAHSQIVFDGGGLANYGILSLTNSTVSDNQADGGVGIVNFENGKLALTDSEVSGNAGGYGGGILNRGEMTITNSIISDNITDDPGGGVNNDDTGTLKLTDSVVSDNSSDQGGGVSNYGEITITNSTISGNHATGSGGGIYNSMVGDITSINSTINNNQSEFFGGGIRNIGGIKLINSTISGNWTNGSGGGIYVDDAGTLEARNATIVDNTAKADGSGLSDNGGGIKNNDGTVNLFNTILALNIHIEKSGDFLIAVDDDCKGGLDQVSYSLITTTTGCTFTNDNSITGQNPKLEALADNGGRTQTQALKAESPTIDAGNPNGCKDPQANDLTTDQRGEIRPFDGDLDGTAVCDIGAYEFILYQQLTVNKIGTGDGLVSSSPAGIDCGQDCSAALPQDSLFTLRAAPDAGSTFSGWSGDCSGTGDCEITMDAQKTITATFETQLDLQLTVTKAGTGDGRVSSSPAGNDCGQNCSASFAPDSLVTLTADPDESSTFNGWSGACSGTGDCEVTMDTAKTVTATFTATIGGLLKLFLPLSLR